MAKKGRCTHNMETSLLDDWREASSCVSEPEHRYTDASWLPASSLLFSLSFSFFFCLSGDTGRRLFFTNFCSVPPSIGFPVHNHQSPSVWHIFYHFYSPIFTISRSYSFLLHTTTRTLFCFFPWRSLCSQLFFWKLCYIKAMKLKPPACNLFF